MKTSRKQRVAGALAGIVMILGLTAPAWGDMQIDARIAVHPRPTRDLQISVWPDRGEGASYTIGDPIAMNVQVNRDCFLILYNIDTRGNLRILFPYDPWDDNFVKTGDIIRFPRPQDGNDWTVDGPEGVEYVQAIATEFPIDPPDWPVYIRSSNDGGAVYDDPELRDFRSGSDRLDYIDVVNRKITGRYWNWCATDLATFHVIPRYYRHVNINYDPWPDEFFGEVYINWPIGASIYVDGVYLGIAPLWLPRTYYGHHVVTCYRGANLVRRHAFVFYPKWDYRGRIGGHDFDDIREHGYVKQGQRGGIERFGDRIERYKERREDARREVVRERVDNRQDRQLERFRGRQDERPEVEQRTRDEGRRELQRKADESKGWNAVAEPHRVDHRDQFEGHRAQVVVPESRPEPQPQRENKKSWLSALLRGSAGTSAADNNERRHEARMEPGRATGSSERVVAAPKNEKSRELTSKSKEARVSNEGKSKRERDR